MYIKIICILLLIDTPLHAQLSRMIIDGRPRQLNEKCFQRRDANGRLCAVIKVISEMEGFRYDSYNGIVGKVIDNPGLDLIYLSPDERVFIIYQTHYEPKKIILSELGINLEENQVWELIIKGSLSHLLPISFMVEPKEANIYIDGKAMGSGPIFQLNQGKHIIRIVKENYITIEDTISVNMNNALYTFSLATKPEMVLIEGGTFQIGNNFNDRNNDEKQWSIITLNSFYISKHEVTQSQWVQVMGTNPSLFKGNNLPVESVSWYEAIEFCNKLSIISGLAPCYTIDKFRKDPNNTSMMIPN